MKSYKQIIAERMPLAEEYLSLKHERELMQVKLRRLRKLIPEDVNSPEYLAADPLVVEYNKIARKLNENAGRLKEIVHRLNNA